MLVFDLSHDRIASTPLVKVSNVQQAVIGEKARYTQAARRIGLTPREFDEMERRTARGEIARTTLPVRLDAMAGMHRDGRIYAIHNVRVLPNQSAYVIALSDGKRVYVPVVCGNLSVLQGTPPRPARIARVQASAHASTRRTLARRTAPPVAGPIAAAPAGALAAPQLLPAAAAPPPPAAIADVSPALIAPSSAANPGHATGFHLPLGWLAGALGAIGAFWSGGGTSNDVCT
jgi:hypothetical protein